jgi:hypothetical protein
MNTKDFYVIGGIILLIFTLASENISDWWAILAILMIV